MDQLQVLRLPSMAKFNAGFLQCNQSFEHECVGPSKTNYEHRMMKVWQNLFFSFTLYVGMSDTTRKVNFIYLDLLIYACFCADVREVTVSFY